AASTSEPHPPTSSPPAPPSPASTSRRTSAPEPGPRGHTETSLSCVSTRPTRPVANRATAVEITRDVALAAASEESALDRMHRRPAPPPQRPGPRQRELGERVWGCNGGEPRSRSP